MKVARGLETEEFLTFIFYDVSDEYDACSYLLVICSGL